METYYTKKEYNEMKASLTKEIKKLEKKVKQLEKALSTTDHVTEE
jgi:prefoldin subunit 5